MTAMKTFRVNLRRTTVEVATVIVLAEDAAEAEHMARRKGLADEVWWAEGPCDLGCAVAVIDVENVEE